MAKRLPAGFRLRKDGNYELRFTVKKKRYSVYAASVQECKEKEIALREQIKNGLYTENRNLTLDKFFDEWEKMRTGSVNGNTSVHARCIYNNHIKNVFGGCKLCDIERRQIMKFQNDLQESGKLKNATINSIITLVKVILNDATKNDLIPKNPASGIKILKVEDKPASETIHRALTEEETKLFFDCLKKENEWLYEFFAILIHTGMRIGECSALDWSDIDYSKNVIHVTKTITLDKNGKCIVGNSPKSKAGKRDIPMNESIKAILKMQREKQNILHGNIISIDRPVFESPYGNRISNYYANCTIRRTIKKINEKEEVIQHFSVHSFRDTFATRFIEGGGNPQTLKTILGHSSLAMTMDLYSHVMPNTKQKEMDNIKIAF